ncbi:MAG: shikimate dehydrogenase [Desulfatibacillaceae bacterium]
MTRPAAFLPTAQTQLYCVIGNPVAHSKSPVMHNRAFAETGLDAVYLAFEAGDAGAAMSAVRQLGIQGVSVTVPHKVTVMEYLDEVDDRAKDVGAVNTVKNVAGRLVGRNTDGFGAVRALEDRTPLDSRRVAVVGAGGAARAVAFVAGWRGAKVTVVNRSPDRGRSLASEAGAAFLPLAEIQDLACDVIVNCTSVGMSPHKEESPVPAAVFKEGMVAMDIVYNPLRTRFLEDAATAGCEVVDGLSMFVYQGAAQFEWWTGELAPVEAMRQTVLDALGYPG